ncbi:MAG: DUF488 family protein [Thermomicrobiales bacterium]
MPTLPAIYSIGHSNLAIEAFIERLHQNGVEAIVDVRSAPYSQFNPRFNREDLVRSLDRAGIAYAFAGEYLGGRPKDPACYKNGVVPEGKADYLNLVDYKAVARLPSFLNGLARLLEIAGESRTAMMCSEEDPDHCHRHHLIAQSLLDRDVAVLHIRGNGEIEEAQREAEQLSLL